MTFWPGAPLAAMAAPAVWRARREPGAQYLLAWLLPSWIVFELVMTKLPHYVLPLYPAIAILTAGALERRVLSRSWLTRGAAWWFAIPADRADARRGRRDLADPAAGVPGLAVRGGVADLRAVRVVAVRGQPRRALAAERGGRRRCFSAIAVYGIVMPSLKPLFPSVEIARALRNVVCVGPKAAAAGFHEPSLVFMTGTDTLLTDGSGAADFLRQGSCRFALVEARTERAFAARAEAIGLRYNVATRIDGYNFSQGRAISIAIFRSEGTE